MGFRDKAWAFETSDPRTIPHELGHAVRPAHPPIEPAHIWDSVNEDNHEYTYGITTCRDSKPTNTVDDIAWLWHTGKFFEDSNYPIYDPRILEHYPSGSKPMDLLMRPTIGDYGYDITDRSVKSPQSHTDFMSYCEGEQWISAYHYQKLIN